MNMKRIYYIYEACHVLIPCSIYNKAETVYCPHFVDGDSEAEWPDHRWAGGRAWAGALPVAFCFFHKCPGHLHVDMLFKLQSKGLFSNLGCCLEYFRVVCFVSFLYKKGEIGHINMVEDDVYLDLKRDL